MIDDLDKVDYPERAKTLQKDWIGKSKGAQITFNIKGKKLNIEVFTTRTDTIFGTTYLVLAPEHSIIKKLQSQYGDQIIFKGDQIQTHDSEPK